MKKKTEIPQTETIVNDGENINLETLQANYDSLVAENQQIISELEKLTEENQKHQKTIARLQSSADNSDKFRDQLVALKADFDSYKRRVRGDCEENRKEGRRQAVEAMLPVLDTLSFAKGHLEGDNLKAFEMVEGQMQKILQELGVSEIETLGQDFNVNTMNALSSLDRGEENSGKVVEVYKKGYTLDGKVLRFAEVIVGN